MGKESMMNSATRRSIVRWFHLVLSIPICGYSYSPVEAIPQYAPMVRFIFFPAIVLSGLWMWKGYLVRQLIFGKKSA